jgi:hypothetical protein
MLAVSSQLDAPSMSLCMFASQACGFVFTLEVSDSCVLTHHKTIRRPKLLRLLTSGVRPKSQSHTIFGGAYVMVETF